VWKQKQIIRFSTDGAKHTKIYGFGTERVKTATGGNYFLLSYYLKSSCHLILYNL